MGCTKITYCYFKIKNRIRSFRVLLMCKYHRLLLVKLNNGVGFKICHLKMRYIFIHTKGYLIVTEEETTSLNIILINFTNMVQLIHIIAFKISNKKILYI